MPEAGSNGRGPIRTPGEEPVRLDIARLQRMSMPVQDTVGDVKAFHLGLGSDHLQQVALRKRIRKPGSPWGGMGFFDPQAYRNEATEDEPCLPPPDVTAERVRALKLEQFRYLALGRHSIYFWAVQPIFDVSDRAVACEILVRARNGQDAAPYEDVYALMDPGAPDEVREIYVLWKCTEIVDFCLSLLAIPLFRKLNGIACNVRPLDLSVTSLVYKEVARRLQALPPQDRALLTAKVVIEVTEDQRHPCDAQVSIKAWKALGFRFACDDTIGTLACEALGKLGVNFHTPVVLQTLLEHFTYVKCDMEWAGYAIFLSHPSYSDRAAMKKEVLEHARRDDLVYIMRGSSLESTGVSYTALLREFAVWVKEMIERGLAICIELTVRKDDENNAFATSRLEEMGVDLFGVHKDYFMYQGGLTGARAYPPEALAQVACA